MKSLKTLFFSLVLGVLATPLQAATEIAVEWCDNPNLTAFQISYCNPQLTVNNATAVSSNSAQVVVNTTRADKGLLYTYATTSCSVAPSMATMKATTPIVVQGAAITVPVSGLTPSTNGYCVWAVQEWERRESDIKKTASTFNTTSGAVTPPPLDDDPAQGSNAPVYYVSNSTVGCTDAGAGTSSATPWCNVTKIASLTGTTSAKVYLKSGDIWLNQTVDVNFNGTATDIGHVGCYKLVSSNPKICAATDTDPEVRGWTNDACIAAKNCPYGAWQAGINNEYDAQFTVFSNYIDVQDITLRHTAASAYQVYGEGNGYSNPGPGNINDIRFIRANTYNSGNSPFVLSNGVRRIVVRDSIVDGYNLCLSQVKTGGLASTWCQLSNVGWPGGIQVVRSPACDCLIENNIITRGWGEGMNQYAIAEYVAFRGNRVGNTISAGEYSDASSDSVSESNILWGTQGNAGYPTGSNFGGGNVYSIEDPVANLATYNTVRHISRNNVMIDTGWNGAGLGDLANINGRLVGVKFYNNAYLSSDAPSIDITNQNSRLLDMKYVANIEYTTDFPGVCRMFSTGTTLLNNVHATVPTGNCAVPSNRIGTAQFAVNRPYSFWDTVDYTNHTQIQMSDFIPLATSPVVGYGDPAAKDEVCIDISKYSYALANMSVPFVPDPVTWGKCHAFDMDGTLVDSTPDAGPQEITTVVTPPTPSTGYRLVSADGPFKIIRNGGNNALSGNDFNNAWATLSMINSSLAQGMNICLYNTSIFKNQEMTIVHPGASNDWNIIAGCKLDSENQLVWIKDEIPGPSSLDQKPVLEGNITLADIEAGNVNYTDTFPIDTYTSHYDPVARVDDTADYTELRNIEWRYHRWDTLRVGTSATPYVRTLEYQIQDGLDFHHNGNAPYVQGVSNGVWRNGSTWLSNLCWTQKIQQPSPGSEAGCDGDPNGGGFALVNTEKYLVETTYIADMIVEGIDIFRDSNNNIIRGNLIGDVHNICIYNDSSRDTVIENNICVYNSTSSAIGYALNTTAFKGGIWVDQEYYAGQLINTSNLNIVVRNNLILNAKSSLTVSIWLALINQDTGVTKKTSGYFVGNTVIGSNNFDMEFWSYHAPDPARVQYYYANNNVFWSQGLGASSCFWRTISNTSMNGNHFFVTQNDADCNSATNTVGSPLLALPTYAEYLAKNIDNNIPTFEQIRPAANSPLINTGVDTSATILDPNAFGLGALEMDSLKKGRITLANWAKIRGYTATDEAPGTTKGAMCPPGGCGATPVAPVSPVAITVSPNGRYFRKNGQPFNWVGCTGWLVSDQSTADITTFLEDQASRGCNVVHGPIMNSIFDAVDDVNGPISSTSPYTMRTAYFSSKVDWYVNEATRLGMNIMFPLCWGPNCKRDMLESAVNARTYANFIVERYNDYPNIIWIVAGEYTKMSDNPPDYLPSGDAMDANELSILDALIAGAVANKHPDQLLTIHPDGGRSSTDTVGHPGRNLHNETWLSFNTIQSYNSQYENIVDVDYDYSLSPIKPTLQDELFYEEQAGIPGDGGSATPWHVRIGAWAARLSGSAGFTYGHGCIWYFCSGWASQLADAGATDIFTHYKAFWDEHHSETLIKSRDWLTGDKGTNVSTPSLNTYETAMRSADGSKLIVYSPKGDNINVITNNMSGTLRARWFDPRNGGYTAIADPVTKSADTTFDPPNSPAIDNDWVLVID